MFDLSAALTRIQYKYAIQGLYLIAALLTIRFCDGTGDAGDSIQHYLIARYAPVQPELFFNHWGKPVFTLLASAFAWTGFTGIKVFNVLVAAATIWLMDPVARLLGLKAPLVGMIALIFTPLYYMLTFSGLTEPLFALWLLLAIYLVLKGNTAASMILISFLPFVRSEGLIILGVFALYLLLVKRWKLLPLLATGHIVYAIAGSFVFHDLLWVINRIPYSRLSSIYGHGGLLHFVDQLFYVIGAPLYVLLVIGMATVILGKKAGNTISLEEKILVFGSFLCFFVAHTLFWYLGIFNSMGLKRVFLGVAPLMALLANRGFETIAFHPYFQTRPVTGRTTTNILLLLIIAFPLLSKTAGINWGKDMQLTEDQRQAQVAVDVIRQLPIDSSQRFFFTHPYLSELLGVNFFDPRVRLDLTAENLASLKTGDLVIWENWFAVVENNITEEILNKTEGLKAVWFGQKRAGGRDIRYVIYEVK